jgi:deoxyribodipyrimidine photo-lyase
MKEHRTALVWFRRDLRLADNPALMHAVAHAEHILPVYVHDEDDEWPIGAASAWWLHHSLVALDSTLAKRGSRLTVLRGPAEQALLHLIDTTGATLVTWNRLYEPQATARDKTVETSLQGRGIAVETHNASLMFEPWEIRNGQRKPYLVFGAFWRQAQSQLQTRPSPLSAPRRITGPAQWPASIAISDLELLPKIRWDAGLSERWEPGESGAMKQLKRFTKVALDYRTGRDRPDLRGTSSLSPHLHFGEIGPRQLFAELKLASPSGAGAESLSTYASELGWREFAHHLLFHFPHTMDEPLDARFTRLRWSKSRKDLRAWQRGCAGIPIVDAGMRELWHTGWMHNRVRMIVASFLTKNLQLHWREGARWFWDTLVDADAANNTMGWQWVAGCGADAAPYYRIFNPVLQAEKFDPERKYLRQWLPELASLPDKWIHQPWTAPASELARANVKLGVTYPKPIVDLKQSRMIALGAYEQMRQLAEQ